MGGRGRFDMGRGVDEGVDEGGQHSTRHNIRSKPPLIHWLLSHSLGVGYKWLRDVDEFSCKAVCLEDDKCIAMQYTRSCSSPMDDCMADRWVCRLIGVEQEVWEMVQATHTSKLVIFASKLQFANVSSLFIERAFLNATGVPVATGSTDQCEQSCNQIAHCDAITYTNKECSMYAISQNPHLIYKEGGTTLIRVKSMYGKIIR